MWPCGLWVDDRVRPRRSSMGPVRPTERMPGPSAKKLDVAVAAYRTDDRAYPRRSSHVAGAACRTDDRFTREEALCGRCGLQNR